MEYCTPFCLNGCFIDTDGPITNIKCRIDDTWRSDGAECPYMEETEPDTKGTEMEKTRNKVEMHEKICRDLNALYARKNHDYGDSFSETFQEFGLTMSAIRLGDKYKRFKTLIKNEELVTDESIIDTLMDLANYSIMTIIELETKQDR